MRFYCFSVSRFAFVQCIEDRPADFPFIRKGIVGDWRNMLSREQSQRIDAKLAETASKYPKFAKLWDEYEDLLK